MIEQAEPPTIEELVEIVDNLRAERDAMLKISFPLPDPDAVPQIEKRSGGRYEVIRSPQRNKEWTLGTHYISIPGRRNFARATKLKQKVKNTEQAADLWRLLLVKEEELKALKARQQAVMAFA